MINRYEQVKAERREAYKFIRSYQKAHGKVPTYSEIAEELDVSKNTAGHRVRELEQCGLVVFEKHGVKGGYRLASKTEVEVWKFVNDSRKD